MFNEFQREQMSASETTRYCPHQNVLVAWTQIKTLYKQQTPHLQNYTQTIYKQQTPQLHNYTQTNLGLWNTTLGNHIHVQHRNARTLPVEGSVHDNGRTMVCVEYSNTEGFPETRQLRNIAYQIQYVIVNIVFKV
jgi:hypothetical protein